MLVVACGPVLTAGDGAEADDTTGGGGEEPMSPWEPLPSGCEPEPEDGVDPFATVRPCDAYDGTDISDISEIPEIEVRILNRGDRPILVWNRTSGCRQPARYFVVEGRIGGRDVEAVTDFCSNVWGFCGAWTGASSSCRLCATLHPLMRIEPGGASVETWSAWLLGEVVLPAQCNELSETDETCNPPIPIVSGRYTLQAEATSVDQCEGDCACEPDEHGSCPLPLAGISTVSEASLAATAVFDGKCRSVDIVFE